MTNPDLGGHVFKDADLIFQLAQQQISKIVVPIDGSEKSMEAADYAVKMAERYGSEVAVVYVIHMDQNLELLGIYRLSGSDPIKKKMEEARADAQNWFAEIRRNAEQRKVHVKTDVIEFPMSVVGTIVEYAVSENADAIVIGTRGRSGISKMLLGSVASGVVSYAPCPVVVVK
jgi:nucleotide-binding universal stress UspA family protein